MSTAGRMKQRPARRRPRQPPWRSPIWMAISVELGPGMRFVAPRRSRNSASVSHRRRVTTSSFIMAIWAAGPPNAVKPSRRKSRVSSPSACDDAAVVTAAVVRSVLSIASLPFPTYDAPLCFEVALLPQSVEGRVHSPWANLPPGRCPAPAHRLYLYADRFQPLLYHLFISKYDIITPQPAALDSEAILRGTRAFDPSEPLKGVWLCQCVQCQGD